MTDQKELGKTLWNIADQLRGAMSADDFRDYMLSFLFLRYLSDNYVHAVKRELGSDYPTPQEDDARIPLQIWYDANADDVVDFENQMRLKVHYVIEPPYLWSHIAEMARTQDDDLLNTLQSGFKYIENKSFESTFNGLFSEINLGSEKLGKDYTSRNKKLTTIIAEIAKGLDEFSTDKDTLGDAYEYLIGQFAAGSGKKAGEFYTPQQISNILSSIVTLDSQEPKTGKREKLDRVLDFACGSGSLLLNIRRQVQDAGGTIGKIFGQEKNITTYNLARMNMLLHGVKDAEFEIYHGDTLDNEWDAFREENPAKKPVFDAVVANPPFSLRWSPGEETAKDLRFKNHGVAPKSAADFAFLLHGFNYLKEDGVMAIILPHGVLFRGGVEAKIRKKLLDDGHIDTVIGLPANLFYSTGIPVCILVLKKCKKSDDVLFINASEHYAKDKRQNRLRIGENDEPDDIEKIINTYIERPEKPIERYARRVSMDEIKENDYNLNITRYVSTAEPEPIIDLAKTHKSIVDADKDIHELTKKHNAFLKELGLPLLPEGDLK
ncbi:type I restriction-modification system subunit M [Coraliomargarita algicola]|uniref:site-specific DNA-methyltransferase (adenine-specific) n=1 Tax=Coraliomargarita algicola TaxID=3092156 RepID=A0ABZ0RJG8_9BACT|nr:type I restriction-modification system subunit M [Coraliomargarita sp. J2-16]WPJ95228.1 type I restriction-modification system subunit M [Coraliomargarita sp. J2-16]